MITNNTTKMPIWFKCKGQNGWTDTRKKAHTFMTFKRAETSFAKLTKSEQARSKISLA